MGRERDIAWTQVDRDPEKEGVVIYNLCKARISLGATKRNQSIGAAKRHLQSQHKQVFFLSLQIC